MDRASPEFAAEEIEQEEAEVTVLVLRYAAQIARLVVMLRHFRRQQQSCMHAREVRLDQGSLPASPRALATSGVSFETVVETVAFEAAVETVDDTEADTIVPVSPRAIATPGGFDTVDDG